MRKIKAMGLFLLLSMAISVNIDNVAAQNNEELTTEETTQINTVLDENNTTDNTEITMILNEYKK